MLNGQFADVQCVFLDRDGCINRTTASGYVTHPDEMELLPGVAQAIRQLNKARITVIVVTNQRGISQRLYTEEGLADIHTRMAELLRKEGAHVDAIFYCPHDRDCRDCRKPEPGLLLRALSENPSITPRTSVMIGNSHTDILAGRRAGTRTILIGEDAARNGEADAIVGSLADAVHLILRDRSQEMNS